MGSEMGGPDHLGPVPVLGPEMLYFVGLHTQKMENEHQSPHMEIESRPKTLN